MRIDRIPQSKVEKLDTSPVDLTLMEPLIEKHRHKKGNMIPLLQGTQEIYGYIPHAAFLKLNSELGLELNEMYGVATFYAQFRLQPVGKYMIKMCHGTACHVQNVSTITDALLDHLEINDGETTGDGLFTLETVACVGCCSLAPVMMIDDDTHGKLSPKSALKVIRNIRRSNENGNSNKTGQT